MQPIREINYSIADEKSWSVSFAYKGYGYAIKRNDGSFVCNVAEGLRPQEKALAQLIAATPTMLEALKKAERVLRLYTAEDPSAYVAQEQVQAAIKLATIVQN